MFSMHIDEELGQEGRNGFRRVTNASVVARPLPKPAQWLPQHGANADENEVTNCEYDRQLNDHDGDAKENA